MMHGTTDGRRRRLSLGTRGLGLVLVAAVVGACSGPAASPFASAGSSGDGAGVHLAIAKQTRAPLSAADAASAARASNDFGFELYRRAGPGNLVFSPASIALALSMARAGAAGETATQMDAVLRDLAAPGHERWIDSLDQSLAKIPGTFTNSFGKDVRVTLRIANAPFAQRSMTLTPGYLDALSSRFGAGLRLVDYRTDYEAARKLINAWVDGQTEQRIPALLAPGVLDEYTRLVLVNAIYLKAGWRHPFLDANTSDETFTRADGSAVTVPTMRGTHDAPYASGDGWKAVDLPYVGDRLAMTLVLPDDMAAFEKSLTATRFGEIVAKLEPREVRLSMPRFKLETKTELADVLSAMGMPLAFTDRADFSGMTRDEQLRISAVVHQANIDVDEHGTTAAAATAVVMAGTAAGPEPIELKLDRPFVFALRDRLTGAVLFLGRVSDPS